MRPTYAYICLAALAIAAVTALPTPDDIVPETTEVEVEASVMSETMSNKIIKACKKACPKKCGKCAAGCRKGWTKKGPSKSCIACSKKTKCVGCLKCHVVVVKKMMAAKKAIAAAKKKGGMRHGSNPCKKYCPKKCLSCVPPVRRVGSTVNPVPVAQSVQRRPSARSASYATFTC